MVRSSRFGCCGWLVDALAPFNVRYVYFTKEMGLKEHDMIKSWIRICRTALLFHAYPVQILRDTFSNQFCDRTTTRNEWELILLIKRTS